MATITTGAHPKALWPGVKSFFGKTYDEKPLMATRILREVSSDKKYRGICRRDGVWSRFHQGGSGRGLV
jgi:hypothetical protein